MPGPDTSFNKTFSEVICMLLVCLCVVRMCMQTTGHPWRSKDSLREWVLFLHHLWFGDLNFIRLGGKYCLLSCLLSICLLGCLHFRHRRLPLAIYSGYESFTGAPPTLQLTPPYGQCPWQTELFPVCHLPLLAAFRLLGYWWKDSQFCLSYIRCKAPRTDLSNLHPEQCKLEFNDYFVLLLYKLPLDVHL